MSVDSISEVGDRASEGQADGVYGTSFTGVSGKAVAKGRTWGARV